MRIGIITYHSVYNFGANLQAFSTIGYLRNNGFDPIIIDWIPKDLEDGYNRGNTSEQAKAHQAFVKEFLPLTKKCRNTNDVAETIKEYNIGAVVIGSDAVLQHKTFLSRVRLTKRGIKIKAKRTNAIFPNPFWGSFIPELEQQIPVSVMSASSQNMNFKFIKGPLKKKIGKALESFKIVTVRDDWTKEMIRHFTKGRIVPEVTPDPVFAFNQNIKSQPYKEEILKKYELPEKYMLFSFKHEGTVSNDWLKNFRALLEKENIMGVILTMPAGIIFKNPPMQVIAPPLNPIDWYTLIKYSSGYVGENMHPVVVALHNSVPFFSFDFYGIVKYKYFVNEESSKIHNLLSLSGFLPNRVCTLRKGYVCPSPENVLNMIKNFNTDKCSQFSIRQMNRYNVMMENITRF